jgi:hypothetical protein
MPALRALNRGENIDFHPKTRFFPQLPKKTYHSLSFKGKPMSKGGEENG